MIRDAILPIVLRRAAADDGRSTSWLQDHHIDFESRISTAALAAP